MQKMITKEQLHKKINELSGEYEVIGPKEVPGKGIFYQPLTDAGDLYLGGKFATEPVKKFFLEPSTWLSEHSAEGGLKLKPTAQPEKKRIIIAARPCEARGLALLDKIFDSADYKDSFFINNRKRTTIVTLACQAPDEDCFCASMGGSPAGTAGADAVLLSTEGGFALEAFTDKAKDIFGRLSTGSRNSNNSISLKRNIKAPESLGPFFSSDYWDEASKPCLSCGICTYLCPTCHCFDLVDEKRKKLRCYDGCAFAGFTLEASGVNPRPAKKERYRQRVFHKFDYFKKNFGENLCVGCGRCIRYCPVRIDIADIVDKVR